MSFQTLSTFIIIAITTASVGVWAAAEKTNCTLVSIIEETATRKAKPPTVTIFPRDPTDEYVQVEFTIPSFIQGTPDQLKRYKIKDKDGSVELMMLIYLYQNSNLAPGDTDKMITAALEKRRAYWDNPANANGVDPTLIQTSLDVNKFLLNKNKPSFSETDRKQIITDILGPITDYDTNLKYEYKEVDKGAYVTRPAKRLADIFPPEFYDVATSTSSGGFLKDRKNPGVTSCEFLPVPGRLPKAGKVESIRRPGQR